MHTLEGQATPGEIGKTIFDLTLDATAERDRLHDAADHGQPIVTTHGRYAAFSWVSSAYASLLMRVYHF